MKELFRAMIEEEIKAYEFVIDLMMDDLNTLVDTLESLIEEPTKSKQELLEDELEELIAKCTAVSFYREDDVTIAVITLDGRLMPEVGVAKCCPTDEFDALTGEVVALKKALGLPIDSKQYGEPKEPKAIQHCSSCLYEELEGIEYPCNKCLDSSEKNYWEAANTTRVSQHRKD